MNRVVLCLGGYAAGLVLAQYLEVPSLPVFLAYSLLFVLLLFCRKPRPSLYLLLLFCLLTGLLRYPARLAPSSVGQLDALVEAGMLRLEGRVLATQERPDNGLVVDIELLGVESRPTDPRAQERLRLYVANAEQTPPVGSRLAFRSRIRRTRNFGIPGEFDAVRHLAYRRIWHTAYLSNARGLALFAEAPSGLGAQIDALRRSGLTMLDRTLSEEDALLLKGLLLGEKGGMPTSLRQQLAAGGVSHLFAISGLHLGLLAWLIYALLRYGYSRSTRLLLWQPPVRVLWLFILPTLFCYLLLTGDALATRRAFYALSIVAALGLLRRRIDPLNLLYALAFLFLLIEPLALWQPSFLLSFSGVLGILLWQKPFWQLLRPSPRLVRYPLQLFTVSLAAFIGTLPAVVFIFHLLAPAGLLCNLLAIPLVSFVALPLGLAGLLATPLLPELGELLLHVAAWALHLVVGLAGVAATLPGLWARSIFLTLPETLALLLACLALLVVWRRPRALLMCFCAVCLLASGSSAVQAPELILFSVGQGEALLLRSAGKAILIDGGGLRSVSFDVGERLLAPALGRLGVKTLDAIILTHDHPDHSGGLNYIINHLDVREFWSTAEPADLRPELRQALVDNGVAFYRYDSAGWQRRTPGGMPAVSLFTAPADIPGENNRSICLYLATSAGGILLTGDLEARGVESLLHSALPGEVGFLKAPHHGSRSSNPQQLLAQLQPRVVLISAGYQNPYHFPARQLLDQAARQEVEVWRTDRDGTLRLRVNGQHWQVAHWEKGLFR